MELYELIQLSNKLNNGIYKKTINDNFYELEVIEKKDKINKIVTIKKNGKTIYNIKIQNLIDLQFRVTIYFNDYELTTLNYYKDFENFFIRKDEFFLFKDNIDVNGISYEIKDDLLFKSLKYSISDSLLGPRIAYDLKDKNIYLFLRKYDKLLSKDLNNSSIKVKYSLELLDSMKRYNELLEKLKKNVSSEIENSELQELFSTFNLPLLKIDYENEIIDLLNVAQIYEENKDKLKIYDVDNSLKDLISFITDILGNDEYLTIQNIKQFIEDNDLLDENVRIELENMLNKVNSNNKSKKLTLDS